MHLDKLHLHIVLHFATITVCLKLQRTKALKWSFQAKMTWNCALFFFLVFEYDWEEDQSSHEWKAECCSMSVLLKCN